MQGKSNESKPRVAGQGTAKKAAPRAPIKAGNAQRAAGPSKLATRPVKAPGSGTNSTSKGANKVGR